MKRRHADAACFGRTRMRKRTALTRGAGPYGFNSGARGRLGGRSQMPDRRYPLRVTRTGNNCLNHAFDRRQGRHVKLNRNTVGKKSDRASGRSIGFILVVVGVASRLLRMSARFRSRLVVAQGFMPIRPQRQNVEHQNHYHAERRREATKRGVGLDGGAGHGVESWRVSKSSSALDLAINQLTKGSRLEGHRQALKMPGQ